MRTFTRDQLDEANAAWDDGDFSKEWRDVRHLAAMGGIIYPPSGTKWDSWGDAEPSQRAILIRAIRETPVTLRRCVRGATSWGMVIDRLLHVLNDEWGEEIAAKEREAARRKAEENPEPREATMVLADVLRRIGDSA